MAKTQRTPAFVSPEGGAWLRWLDETREYLVVGEQTLGRCAIARQTLSAGGSTIACIRDGCQSGFFILDGEVAASAGNRVLNLVAGSFLNIRPGTPYKLHNATTEPARFLTIAAPAGLDEFEFRTGLPLAAADDQPAGLAPEEHDLPASIAIEYDIHLDLLPTAFDVEPCMRVSLPREGQASALAGDVYHPLATSHDTEGRYAALRVLVAPGHALPWHEHAREDLFLHLLSGNLTIESGDQSVLLEHNGFAHLPAGVSFRVTNHTGLPADLLLTVAPAGLEHLIELTAAPWQDPEQLPPRDAHGLEKLAAHAGDFGIGLRV